MYFAFVNIAIYDALVAIEGGHEPFIPQPRAHAHASPEVAAATAAYRVLSGLFPASEGNLAQDYAASLSDVPNGVGLVHGKRVGEAAAASMLELRQDDGRNDSSITFIEPPAPGVWRPTPPANAPFQVPWLGFVDPLVLDSATQIALPGPDLLGAAAYAADFDEVKAAGAKLESPANPDPDKASKALTARFWSVNPVMQLQVAMTSQTADRGLDIMETARAFALLGTAGADAHIACWRTKFDVPFWRPITAIQQADTDGNDLTVAEPGWAALLPTPPYPDYVSGHACYIGAASEVLADLFGADAIDLDVSSSGTSPASTRHYDTVAALDEDTINARIWLGFHFRRAMIDGNFLGHEVADWTIANAFQPVD